MGGMYFLAETFMPRMSPISLTFWRTRSRSERVWAAEMQNRTREVIMGVAGYPTTTTANPLANASLLNAL